MKIADQLKAIAELLDQYAQDQGGGVFVASDPAHMWEMAYAASNKLRVILCCIGEDLRGDFSVAAALARADRQFICLVTKGRSFTFRRGEGLVNTVQNTLPLFEQVSQVRDLIRSMIAISNELPVDYKGFKSFPLERELIMDAYAIEFSLASDLPIISSQPADPVLVT